MKSSKCYFNTTVFKSNLARFAPFSAMLGIIELIIYPIALYSEFAVDNADGVLQIDFSEMLSLGMVSSVFVFLFSAILASLCFSYLFTTNKCYALHAFPVGRTALFTTGFVSGYILLILPQLLAFALSIPALLAYSNAAGMLIAYQLFFVFLYSFLFYAIGVLSVMLAGRMFSSLAVYFIINFFGFVLDYVLFSICDCYYFSFGGSALSYLSPFAIILYGQLDYDLIGSNGIKTLYTALLIYFAVSLVLSLFSYLLYKIRRLECAGDTTAFPVEIPVLKVIVTFIGGFSLAYLIEEIIYCNDYFVFLIYLPCSFICYFGAQMVLKKNTKVFSKKALIGWAVCFAVTDAAVLGLKLLDEAIYMSIG